MANPPQKSRHINLAICAIDSDAHTTERAACRAYDAPRSTLRDRRRGVLPRADSTPNGIKLTNAEEKAIIDRILDLDLRGFPPSKDILRDMANKLLEVRNAGTVGKNWPDRFVARREELKTCYSRAYDRQRALNEDPKAIEQWFQLVYNMKEKYGILDDDTYNFDETGFMMGVITSQLVITGSERRGKRKTIQPGNREWTTVINAVNAHGWFVPPFTIFAGKNHINTWYDDPSGMEDWVIAVSPNGWTTNELGIKWLEHFNACTKSRTVGLHRLLIIDGHESHSSVEFQNICQEEKIITLCMPAHSSHLLQPLDVGLFSPLKRAYGDQISGLARQMVTKIDKPAFIQAYKTAFYKVFTKGNILSSFRAAGLVPHDPDVVLSKLDVRLRTPTPPVQETTTWESKTPSNAHELESQLSLVRDRINQCQDSSPSKMIDSINRLAKGAETMMHSMVLMEEELSTLRAATEAANKKKTRKRKYVQNQGTLTIGNGNQIANPESAGQAEVGGEQVKRVCAEGAWQAHRRCGKCGKTGHDRRRCAEDATGAIESGSTM